MDFKAAIFIGQFTFFVISHQLFAAVQPQLVVCQQNVVAAIFRRRQTLTDTNQVFVFIGGTAPMGILHQTEDCRIQFGFRLRNRSEPCKGEHGIKFFHGHIGIQTKGNQLCSQIAGSDGFSALDGIEKISQINRQFCGDRHFIYGLLTDVQHDKMHKLCRHPLSFGVSGKIFLMLGKPPCHLPLLRSLTQLSAHDACRQRAGSIRYCKFCQTKTVNEFLIEFNCVLTTGAIYQ